MRSDVVTELRKPHARTTLEVDDPAPPGTGLAFEAPIVGRVTLSNVGEYVRAQGQLRTVVRFACSRCLCPVSYPLEIELDETCALTEMDAPSAYRETDEDAEPIPIVDDDVVDLSELVRQSLVVAVPSTVLCREDCRGLCPSCGCDLNEQSCDCEREKTDPRWAALRELLDRNAEE
jgi:uncharacterized protein